MNTQKQSSKQVQATQDKENSNEKSSTIIVNKEFRKNSRGLGYRLIIGGAAVTSLGTLLELSTFLSYNLLDERKRVKTSSNFHIFSVLHITSATFIAAGITSMISGATYIDDSVYGRNYWKKTQVITGSVLTSVGTATTIAGSLLYTIVDMKDIGAGVIGGGISLIGSGIASLFIGLFVK